MKKQQRYRAAKAIMSVIAIFLILSGAVGAILISRSYRSKALEKASEKDLTVAAAVSRNVVTTNKFIYDLLNDYFFAGDNAGPEAAYLESGNTESLQAYLESCAAGVGDLNARMVSFAPDGTPFMTGNVDPGLAAAAEAHRTDTGDLSIHYIETGIGDMYLSYCFSSDNGFRYSYIIPIEQMFHFVTDGVVTENGCWITLTNRSGDFLYIICQDNFCLLRRDEVPSALPELDPAALSGLAAYVNRSQTARYDGRDYLVSGTSIDISDDTLFICVVEDMESLTVGLDDMTLQLSVLTAMIILGIALLALWAVRTTADQRRADEALETEKANTKMRLRFTEAQRLQEMGALSAVIAHEVNNLMTPIMANSLMLLEGTPPDDTDNYDSLLEIYNASEHAKDLIGRISAVNRRDDKKAFAPLKVDTVLRQAYRVLDVMPKVNISVVLNTGCGDATVNGSEMLLLQVIINLCTNAYHAMEETGGVLTISSRLTSDGRHAEITVSDTGGGIPENDIDRIFEAFYTTKPAGKGTGLGLAIVKEIVRELGGTVSVANRGGGAEFTVSLPVIVT